MMVNAEGITLIKQWEGLKLAAYRDIGGIWTIGYGHTATAREGMTITKAEAEKLLADDLRDFEEGVSKAVEVPLSENQFAALVAWTYNVGIGAMRKSTLIRRLNAGDYAAVPAELAKWNKVRGKPVRGLANRRAAEAGLWARGSHVTSREVLPDSENAAVSTGTGKAAIGVGAAGVLSTIAQHADAVSALGALGPIIGVTIILTAAVLFILWRKGIL